MFSSKPTHLEREGATDWFDPKTKPIRSGVYEVQWAWAGHNTLAQTYFNYYDAEKDVWYSGWEQPMKFNPYIDDPVGDAWRQLAWRGLMRSPYKRIATLLESENTPV